MKLEELGFKGKTLALLKEMYTNVEVKWEGVELTKLKQIGV